MSEYTIRLARQTGGKAGKGHNKTSTVQVFQDSMIVKQFRFLTNDPESLKRATEKAKTFVQSKGQHGQQ